MDKPRTTTETLVADLRTIASSLWCGEKKALIGKQIVEASDRLEELQVEIKQWQEAAVQFKDSRESEVIPGDLIIGLTLADEAYKCQREIVDKLPKYADTGKAILPDDMAYIPSAGQHGYVGVHVVMIGVDCVYLVRSRGSLNWVRDSTERLFSTPEAAEAAK